MQELKPIKEGKVREIYDNGDSLIMVATDRISCFDVILNNEVTKKGTVLTQMSKFWFDLTEDILPNHMISVDTKDMPEFFQHIIQTLCSHVGYCNSHNLNAGNPYGAMLDITELRQNHLDTYAYFFTKVIDFPEGHPCHIKPAGTYATACLKGDYYQSEQIYQKLFQWIDDHGFRTGQYSYKEAVIDELATSDTGEYLTRVSVQILKPE